MIVIIMIQAAPDGIHHIVIVHHNMIAYIMLIQKLYRPPRMALDILYYINMLI